MQEQYGSVLLKLESNSRMIQSSANKKERHELRRTIEGLQLAMSFDADIHLTARNLLSYNCLQNMTSRKHDKEHFASHSIPTLFSFNFDNLENLS